MGISELDLATVELFNHVKDLPSIDGKQTVILNKQEASEKLGISIENIEYALSRLCSSNGLPDDTNVFLCLDLNPNSLNEIRIKWRFDPSQPFL